MTDETREAVVARIEHHWSCSTTRYDSERAAREAGVECDCDRRALVAEVERLAADKVRLDWLAAQAKPHHGVIVCVLDIPDEPKWASVQRVDQFHNPHKVEWCHEGTTLREAIDAARRQGEG